MSGSAVLDIEIEADSVNTGSHMKDNKLKGKDFFNVKDSPLITFKSTKIVQTGPNTFDIEGNFTIRGVTKTEKLTLTSDSKGTLTGSLDGTMAFDRKDYGMNERHPFHQDRQPRRGKCSTEVAPCQRSATGFRTISPNSSSTRWRCADIPTGCGCRHRPRTEEGELL